MVALMTFLCFFLHCGPDTWMAVPILSKPHKSTNLHAPRSTQISPFPRWLPMSKVSWYNLRAKERLHRQCRKVGDEPEQAKPVAALQGQPVSCLCLLRSLDNNFQCCLSHTWASLLGTTSVFTWSPSFSSGSTAWCTEIWGFIIRGWWSLPVMKSTEPMAW